jgi:hypothetical protein
MNLVVGENLLGTGRRSGRGTARGQHPDFRYMTRISQEDAPRGLVQDAGETEARSSGRSTLLDTRGAGTT